MVHLFDDLFFAKAALPFAGRFQVDEHFGHVDGFGVGAVFRPAGFGDDGTDLGSAAQDFTDFEAIGAKMRPSCRCKVKIGMWAAMMINIEKNVGRPTSTVASSMTSRSAPLSALFLSSPSRRKTFSTTMTAPSTTMPKSIAPRERRLAGMPRQVSPMNVASSESGIRIATIAAARKLPRNSSNTKVTSIAPS